MNMQEVKKADDAAQAEYAAAYQAKELKAAHQKVVRASLAADHAEELKPFSAAIAKAAAVKAKTGRAMAKAEAKAAASKAAEGKVQ